MIEILKANLTEFAMKMQALLFPQIHVGPYVFVRKHVVILLQGLVEYDLCGMTKDSVVLDIGASVGGFTVMARRDAGTSTLLNRSMQKYCGRISGRIRSILHRAGVCSWR